MGFNVTWNEVDILPEASLQQFWHNWPQFTLYLTLVSKLLSFYYFTLQVCILCQVQIGQDFFMFDIINNI